MTKEEADKKIITVVETLLSEVIKSDKHSQEDKDKIAYETIESLHEECKDATNQQDFTEFYIYVNDILKQSRLTKK